MFEIISFKISMLLNRIVILDLNNVLHTQIVYFYIGCIKYYMFCLKITIQVYLAGILMKLSAELKQQNFRPSLYDSIDVYSRNPLKKI